MIDVIITGAVGLVTSIVTGVASWLFARKKYNAEVDSTRIDNLQKSLDFYIKLADDNNKRLEDVLKRNEYLEKKDDKLEEEVARLRNQMFTFMQQICLDFTCNRRVKNQELFGPIKPTKSNKSTSNEDKAV